MRRILEVSSGDDGEIILKLAPPKRLPEHTQAHLREASKEALMTLRSIIDEAIKRLEPEKGEAPRKIDIE